MGKEAQLLEAATVGNLKKVKVRYIALPPTLMIYDHTHVFVYLKHLHLALALASSVCLIVITSHVLFV